MNLNFDRRHSAAILAIAWCMTLSSGCGGSDGLAPVSGRVTLGGQPVENAIVQFSPMKEGSPSSGRTDSQGYYELIHGSNEKGAVIGQHIVRVSTYQEADPDADPPKPEIAESVPEKYAMGVQKAVEPGENVLNLELNE